MEAMEMVQALTFDVFGTVLDLEGSLMGPIREFMRGKGTSTDAHRFWRQWRARQRIEQYQDNLLMMGHSGYLETLRRAALYVLRLNKVPFTHDDVKQLMEAWRLLQPFPDAREGLRRLKQRFRLAILSNGNRDYLRYLAKERIRLEFDEVVSAESVGFFKPYPGVYRYAARTLELEPHQIAMISANSFDIMGARACGFRAVWVRRHDLPFEETPFQPNLIVRDFYEMAVALGCDGSGPPLKEE